MIEQTTKFKDISEAELNYKIIAENASDGIVRIDSESKICFANIAIEHIFGYKKDELIGEQLTILMPQMLAEKHQSSIHKYIQTNKKSVNWKSLDVIGKHKNGDEISLEISFGEYKQEEKRYFVGVIRDVTKKVRSINSIRESEKALQGTLDALTAHIAVLNSEGVITKVNKAWRDFADSNDYVGEDYGVGLKYFDICEDDPDFANTPNSISSLAGQGISDVLGGRKNLFEIEYPCHHPKKKRWFILRVTPFGDTDSLGAVIAHENITKRKLAENKTQTSEEKYRVLSEAMPAIMFVADTDGKNTFANRQWYDYTGFTVEQTLGTGWAEAIHPKDFQTALENWADAVKQEKTFESEYRLKRHDGKFRWFLIRTIPRKDSEGNILEWFGTGTDIEDRKNIEEDLRSSEKFNRAVLEGNPDCVKLLDEEGCLQYMNKNGLSLLEIEDFAEYENVPWYKLWDEENQHLVKTAVDDALAGNISRFQALTPTAKGKLKWWDVIVLPIEKNIGKDKRTKVLAVSRDMTETKRISEALLKAEVEQRKEAEAANRAKDEFLSVLSHELRTPLNAMLGWVRMLKTGTLDQARTKQAVEVIERNITLQNELIEDLLDVSRIISGKMLIEKEVLNFSEIVSNTLDIARPLAEKKNIKLSFNNSIGFRHILGDETRLHQVIINLLNNAVKFTPKAGTIKLDLSEDSDKIILEIKDSGVGIKPDFLPQIFERFSQADSTTKRNFSGLGLGLTIVNHLTKLHNGKVEVFSEGKDKGSIFTLKFPIYEQEKKDVSPENDTEKIIDTKKSTPLQNVKILLVDDDMEGLIPLQILLEQEQAIIETANSAEDALELLTTNKFDILISDIGMPVTDGYEMIQSLRKSTINKDIPAIALTAYASLTDKEKAIKLGFQQHVSKPLDYDEFFKILENIVKVK